MRVRFFASEFFCMEETKHALCVLVSLEKITKNLLFYWADGQCAIHISGGRFKVGIDQHIITC